ncbi:pyruvate kinase [Candidatus Peregrinibacteria bacterium]|nr:MAG: pyruvate kinase [Candidatus Peregrinibacteria bacterium]
MSLFPRIIITVGPACENLLQEMQDEGVSIFRLNLSHGELSWHSHQIDRIRALKKPAKIMFDTKGPEIRTGVLTQEISLQKGDVITLSAHEEDQQEDARIFFCSYVELASSVQVGGILQFDNGGFAGEITDISKNRVSVRLLSDGILGSRKHLNLPGVRVHLPTLTDFDKEALLFGKEKGVDMYALSFCRKAEDIAEARAIAGERAQMVAKIENQEGLDNFSAIANAADGIMIARGDLGVEMPIEHVPVLQRKMLRELRGFPNTFSIVATGLLRSMKSEPRPRRAEVTDIATATWEGADYLMLSDETTVGKYPLESIRMLRKTAEFAAENAEVY